MSQIRTWQIPYSPLNGDQKRSYRVPLPTTMKGPQ